MKAANPILYQGWLSKYSSTGGFFANWKERFIVLKRTHIAWYGSDDTNDPPKGRMNFPPAGPFISQGKKQGQLSIVADRSLLVDGEAGEIGKLRAAVEKLIQDCRGDRASRAASRPNIPDLPSATAPAPPAPLTSAPTPPPPKPEAPPPAPPRASSNPFETPPASNDDAKAGAPQNPFENNTSQMNALAGGSSANPFEEAPPANPFEEAPPAAPPAPPTNPFSSTDDASPADSPGPNPFEEEAVADAKEAAIQGVTHAPKNTRRQTPATLPKMPTSRPMGGKRLSAIPGVGGEEEEEEEGWGEDEEETVSAAQVPGQASDGGSLDPAAISAEACASRVLKAAAEGGSRSGGGGHPGLDARAEEHAAADAGDATLAASS